MLVIHGIWAYGALQVWAEDSGLPPQAPPRGGRPSRAPRPHPFAAAPDVLADALADALAGAGTGDLPRKAVDDELTLRLPSTPGGPLASPELLSCARRDHRDSGRPQAVAGRLAGSRARLRARSGHVAAGRARRTAARRRRGQRLDRLSRRHCPVRRRPGVAWPGTASARRRKTAGTPPDGGPCCPPPMRGTPASSPPRCRPPAAPCRPGLAPYWHRGRAPRRGRCSRTCSMPSRIRQRAPGCRVRCCPRAEAAAPPASSLAERMLLALTAPRASPRGGGRDGRARGAGPCGRVRGLAGERRAPRRLGPYLLPPGRAAR